MKNKTKKSVYILALIVLLSPAYAAVSVETFTCNGMSGTVAVENGATFSCQASIKNEDTQNSANIGSVSLLVNGNWAEKTSYTGTGFFASLGAGASTTAVFSGIKAVTPGATNKFQSIQIDSSSDTFVTNTNVNVITIKSLTVTASSSGVAQGSEFDVEATVIAGGDLGSVTLAWSSSGGCSLSSGHSASKDAGSLSHNTEATRSWRIAQGSADCANTVTASGTSSSITTSKSRSVTVSFTGSSSSSSSTSSSGGGGGGGGGGGAGAAKTETKTIKEIKPGVPAAVEFSTTALNSVTIEVVNTANNVVISVEEVASPGVPQLQNIYKYINITAINLSDSNIKSAKIAFSVDKQWLAGKDKSTVRLNRYTNAWQELPTSMQEENATHVKYSATTPGFTIFAITVQAAAPKEEPKPPQQEKPEERPAEQPQEKQPFTIGGIEIPKPLVDYAPIILIIVIILVAAFGWLHYHKYPRKKYSYKPK